MKIAIVIPARYQSKRLPGKPLIEIAGRSLLHRVWDIAKAVNGIAGVWIATDDPRIAVHAESFGAQAIMTSPDLATGTDRVRAAIGQMKERPDAAINLQGDAVLTPPWVVQALVDACAADPTAGMVTAAVRLTPTQIAETTALKSKSPSSGTMVTMDLTGRALYFSKMMIPFRRDGADAPMHRHIGIYGYRSEVLERLSALPPSPLERAEQLEQLRALENGIPIRVALVDYRGRTHASVDTQDDLAFVEAVIAREGELVP
ncbi:MAG TPA: 3-deoxy-manno-octulosonate cytidylyltransferase [Magnetospirillaceae bacterium]|jgi:3-deoxy-manno-octulosonate cytidylyltransferase (CMP-KDO synthetase)